MSHGDPAKLDLDELAREIIDVTTELVEMGERPTRTSGWERFEWASGFGLNAAGLAAGGPLTPIGLVLFGLGTGMLAYSIARRLAHPSDWGCRANCAHRLLEGALVRTSERTPIPERPVVGPPCCRVVSCESDNASRNNNSGVRRAVLHRVGSRSAGHVVDTSVAECAPSKARTSKTVGDFWGTQVSRTVQNSAESGGTDGNNPF